MCSSRTWKARSSNTMSTKRNVVVALDWSPNTNHTGFYVAKAKGLYDKLNLSVRLLGANEKEFKGSYSGDVADAGEDFPTPCNRVAAGRAHFAMNSPEGAIGWNCPPFTPERPQLKVVAAVLQQQSSALVTLKSSGIDHPKLLDGKRYASYGARFEGRIVQKMIQHDGGAGAFAEECPPMLGIWGALQEGEFDATWVFTGWEGVEAKLKGLELNEFFMQDHGVPYGYAPCLCAAPALLAAEPRLVRDFLAATAEGFQWAAAHPDEAADLLVAGAQEHNGFAIDPALAKASQAVLSPQYLTPSGAWGAMAPARWSEYTAWLAAEGLLTTYKQSRAPTAGVSVSLDELRAGNAGAPLRPDELPEVYTNAFLPDDGGFGGGGTAGGGGGGATLIADLQVVPMPSGTDAHEFKHVEAAIAVIAASGLKHSVNALGTTIEGPADEVWACVRGAFDACLASGATKELMYLKLYQGEHSVDGLEAKGRACAAANAPPPPPR